MADAEKIKKFVKMRINAYSVSNNTSDFLKRDVLKEILQFIESAFEEDVIEGEEVKELNILEGKLYVKA